MADRSKLKIADQNNIDQDDPFAELTKIMGFDPRVPVKRSEAEALHKLSAPAPVVDDFDIDLERELLGEFALDDDEPAPQPPRATAAPLQVVAPATVQQRDDGARETEASMAPADANAGVEAGHADDADIADVMEFDASDFDLAVEEDASIAAADRLQESRDDTDPIEMQMADMEDDVADLDAAFARSMDEDFDDDWEPESAAPRADATEPVRAASPQSDLDATFDVAMAEVDMDFSAVERPQAAAGDIQDDDEQDDADESAFAVQGGAMASARDEAEDDLPEHVETSLEDELNALLGNAARAQPVAVASGQADDDAFEDLDWEFDAKASDRDIGETVEQASGKIEEDGEPDFARVGEPQDDYEIDEQDWGLDPEPIKADADDDAPEFDEAALATTFAEGMDDLLPEEDALRFEDGEPLAEVAAPEAARPVKAEEPDPFEALRRMAGSWRSTETNAASRAAAPATAYRHEPASMVTYEAEDGPEQVETQAPAAYDDVPEIETIDVPESAVALADDLDLPELAFEEDAPPAAYDDLDAEFASLLSEMNSTEATPAAPPATTRDAWQDRGRERAAVAGSYAHPAAAATVAAPVAYASATPAQSARQAEEIDLGELDLNFDDQAFDQAFAAADDQDVFAEIPDYDPDLDDDLSVPAVPPAVQAPSRRGFWIAALVGGVAIAGGVGAFALSFGDSAGTDSPALVKADSAPIKVRPENPGGSVVPNQDNKVYESVANAKGPAAAPELPAKQEKLVTTTEEPVDVAAAEADAPEAPVGFSAEEEGAAPPLAKGEDRIEQVIGEAEGAAGAEEIPAVQPRKVRTMIVKPDGSLVPAEMPTPEASPETAMGTDAQPLEPAQPTAKPAEQAVAGAPEATGTVPPAQAVPAAAAPAEAAPVAEVPAKPKGQTQSSNTPNQVAIAPARPADQPLDIVGEVKPDQVAAIDTQPTATAVASGAWSMQIASQPSQEAAQSTYQDLARRYGGVLSGRSVNIVKAEIAGKGTFWRVRVPAQSRNDAVNLCNNYKAAGGNCFVSK